jgi:hypothetical protein
MSEGVLFSVVINLMVGAYLIYIYPRSITKRLPELPPLFQHLFKTVPIIGYLIIIFTLGYVGWVFYG